MPKAPAPKPKKPIESALFIGSSGSICELVFDPDREPSSHFEIWKPGSDAPQQRDDCSLSNGETLVPPADKHRLAAKGVVLLPARSEAYGTQAELLAELISFIHRYCDVPPFWEELMAHYALTSWVYDRFTAVPYLRFLGEPQSGKTRCLQVVSQLCYKAIVAGGATTVAPLFRLLELYRGTFVIDEADYKHSDLAAEIVKILNCGYMKGLPVLRTEKSGDNYDPRPFDVFGPKVLTTRNEFEDQALETRCLTLRTAERKVRPDIPRQLPQAFYSEALVLRNKLLRWRFENLFRINSDESALLGLETRLTQIGAPLYSVSTDDGFRQRLLKFLADQAEEHNEDRPQRLVAVAIQQLLNGNQSWPVPLTVADVTNQLITVTTDLGSDETFSAKRAGSLIRSLGFTTRRTGTGYKFSVTKTQLDDLLARYPPPSGAWWANNSGSTVQSAPAEDEAVVSVNPTVMPEEFFERQEASEGEQ